MSRLSELSKGRREYLDAMWPANPQLGRPDPIPVKLQVLTDDDFQASVAAAYARFRELKVERDGLTNDDFEAEVAIQVLARACRDCEQPDKVSFVIDAEDLRRNTTPWERAEVCEAWKAFQERRNPTRALTDAERQAVDEAVKKKDAMTLRAFGPDTLASFLLTSDSPPST